MQNLSEMIRFAEAYAALGVAVQEQVTDLLNNDFDDINPAAVKMIKFKLGGMSDELDAIICEYENFQAIS